MRTFSRDRDFLENLVSLSLSVSLYDSMLSKFKYASNYESKNTQHTHVLDKRFANTAG